MNELGSHARPKIAFVDRLRIGGDEFIVNARHQRFFVLAISLVYRYYYRHGGMSQRANLERLHKG